MVSTPRFRSGLPRQDALSLRALSYRAAAYDRFVVATSGTLFSTGLLRRSPLNVPLKRCLNRSACPSTVLPRTCSRFARESHTPPQQTPSNQQIEFRQLNDKSVCAPLANCGQATSIAMNRVRKNARNKL